MAKSVNVEYDAEGNPVVVMTELPPAPPASPKKRIPSSPHKPFMSSNFYDLTKATPEVVKKAADTSIVDLTKSTSSSPEVTLRRPITSHETTRPQISNGQQNAPKSYENDRRQTTGSPVKTKERDTSSGFRALQQMDRQSNTIPTIPGPYRMKRESLKSTSHASAFQPRKRIVLAVL